MSTPTADQILGNTVTPPTPAATTGSQGLAGASVPSVKEHDILAPPDTVATGVSPTASTPTPSASVAPATTQQSLAGVVSNTPTETATNNTPAVMPTATQTLGSPPPLPTPEISPVAQTVSNDNPISSTPVGTAVLGNASASQSTSTPNMGGTPPPLRPSTTPQSTMPMGATQPPGEPQPRPVGLREDHASVVVNQPKIDTTSSATGVAKPTNPPKEESQTVTPTVVAAPVASQPAATKTELESQAKTLIKDMGGKGNKIVNMKKQVAAIGTVMAIMAVGVAGFFGVQYMGQSTDNRSQANRAEGCYDSNQGGCIQDCECGEISHSNCRWWCPSTYVEPEPVTYPTTPGCGNVCSRGGCGDIRTLGDPCNPGSYACGDDGVAVSCDSNGAKNVVGCCYPSNKPGEYSVNPVNPVVPTSAAQPTAAVGGTGLITCDTPGADCLACDGATVGCSAVQGYFKLYEMGKTCNQLIEEQCGVLQYGGIQCSDGDNCCNFTASGDGKHYTMGSSAKECWGPGWCTKQNGDGCTAGQQDEQEPFSSTSELCKNTEGVGGVLYHCPSMTSWNANGCHDDGVYHASFPGFREDWCGTKQWDGCNNSFLSRMQACSTTATVPTPTPFPPGGGTTPTNTPGPGPSPTPFTSNLPPACSNLTIDDTTNTITAFVSDPENAIQKVEFYLVMQTPTLDYCATPSPWTKIGESTSGTNGVYSIVYAGLDALAVGAYDIVANVTDSGGLWCTGNPDGTCGIATTACGQCAAQKVIAQELVCSSLGFRAQGGAAFTGRPGMGDTVEFTCTGSGNMAITAYNFGISSDGGQNYTSIGVSSSSPQVSLPFTISDPGEYVARCQVCAGSTCSPWQNVN